MKLLSSLLLASFLLVGRPPAPTHYLVSTLPVCDAKLWTYETVPYVVVDEPNCWGEVEGAGTMTCHVSCVPVVEDDGAIDFEWINTFDDFNGIINAPATDEGGNSI